MNQIDNQEVPTKYIYIYNDIYVYIIIIKINYKSLKTKKKILRVEPRNCSQNVHDVNDGRNHRILGIESHHVQAMRLFHNLFNWQRKERKKERKREKEIDR